MERLDQVVVGPRLEAGDPVGQVVPGGQHDDRRVAAGAQPPADLQPVHAWQHPVEHDDVGPELLGDADRARTVDADPRLEALVGQADAHEIGDRAVVLDDQRPRPLLHHRPSIAPDAEGRLRGR